MFHLLALTPLGVAALGALFCRFGTGWIGGLVWGALGGGLALACVGLVRRTQWPGVVRLLGSLGFAGGGYFLLLIALGVSFWQWWHAIDPADWRDFSPPGKRFHVSMPGTPVPQAAPPGLDINLRAYALELRRQDIAFAISFGDIPPWQRLQVPVEARFGNSLAGMQAKMPGSQLVAQKDITPDGSPGREYHLRLPGKGMVVARVYITSNRIYVLVIAGSRITPDADEVRTFFDSFHPEPPDAKELAPPRPEENVFPPPQPPKKEKPKPPDSDDEEDNPARKIIGKIAHPVIHLVLARDGHTVAAACENGVIELWDINRGQRQAELRVPNWTVPGGANRNTWLKVALSPDGKTLAVGTVKGDVQLFDATTGKQLAVLLPAVVPDTTTDSVAFSPSGRYLASGHSPSGLGLGQPAIIRLWDVAEHRLVRTINSTFRFRVVALAFTPDGRQLVSASNTETELPWFDCVSGEQLKPMKLDHTVGAIAFTADGNQLLFNDNIQSTFLWDVKKSTSRFLFKAPNNLAAMDISPNGKFVATATVDGDLTLTETANSKIRWERGRLIGHRRTAFPAVAFTSDGKRLLICRHGRLDVWQLDKMIQATPEELAEPKNRPALSEPRPTPGETPAGIVAYVPDKPNDFRFAVSSLALSADNKTLITANMKAVRFWELATGRMRAEVADIDPVALSASPADPVVAVADTFTVHLYDASTARKLGDLEPDEKAILAVMTDPKPNKATVSRVAFAPDGKTLAVAYQSHRSAVIELWDMATKKVGRRFVTETSFGHMAFSPDGRTLATCVHNDPIVRLYDVATGKIFLRLKGIEWGASNVAFSGDGKYAAAAGTGSPMILVWDAHTGRGVKYFRDHENNHRGLHVAFSPDGKTLAAADSGGKAFVYDMASRRRIGSFASATRITSLAFTRDNRTLIAGTDSGWVDLWNVAKLPRPKPPDEAVVEKPADKPAVSGADLQPAGTIEPFLSAVVDPKAGRALTLGWDRFLRVYSYPAFQFERAYWLGATAYQAVLDRERGLLYAAVCDPPALEHKKDKHNWRHSVTVGPADLHVYDVKKILAGEKLSDYMLRPTKMIPLKEPLRHLLMAPDHRWIYYLTDDGKEPSRLGRIDAAAHGKDQVTKIEHSSGELRLSLDGKTLCAGRGSGDPKQKKGFVEVFDAATMKPQRTIETPFVPAQIADGGGGRLFVCGDAPLALLDTKDGGAAVHTRFDFPMCDGYLRVGSASGRLYSVSPTMRSIECYDFTNGAPVGRPRPEEKLGDKGDGSLVSDALVTPDGKYLLFKAGGVVRLAVPGVNRPLPEPPQVEPRPIDAKGWREHKPLADPKKGFMHALAFLPDGGQLAIGGSIGHIYYHDRKSGKVRDDPVGSGIAYLTFHPNGKTVACAFWNRSAHVFPVDLSFRTEADARNLSGYGLDSVAFVPNHSQLAAAGGEQGKEVVFWHHHVGGGGIASNIRDFPEPLTSVALFTDDKRWAAGNIHLAAGSIAGPVYQVTVENQGKGAKPSDRRTLVGHKAEVRCVAFSPNAKLLASAGVDRTVKLWDAVTAKGMQTMSGHQHVVLCIAFSPDSKLLASGGADGVVRVWDVATGAIRATMTPRRPDAMVFALAFAPDGKTLAAACGAEVRQWDVSE
ncbi:MAG TPA: WD40 repeat domain-containing protein [Gemmataceae bacterium]